MNSIHKLLTFPRIIDRRYFLQLNGHGLHINTITRVSISITGNSPLHIPNPPFAGKAFITSRVSSRGNRIGAVFPSVRLCVCVSALSQPNHLTYDLDFVCYVCVCVCVHHAKRTIRQKDCAYGERGRYVNTQAFSFVNISLLSRLTCNDKENIHRSYTDTK